MADTTTTGPGRGRFRWQTALAASALAVSIGASAVLAAEQLALVNAPGCGDGGGCDQAARSFFGKVPGTGWPTSFLGLAWFAMLAAGWLAAASGRGSAAGAAGAGAPAWMRWAARGGAVISVFLIGVMVAGGYLCPYCLAAHLGSFGFLVAVECSARAPRLAPARLPLAAAGAAAVAVTAALAVARAGAHGEADRRLEESAQQAAQAEPEPGASGGGFTGRWRLGPEAAPIRVVIISDYQCPDCREAEIEARHLLEDRDDVSVSAKHFPMCTDCNSYATRTLHPNACWAARAAETAGRLRGNDGFWQMHRWLFDRGGGFTNDELAAGLAQLGYDLRQFLAVMQGPEVLSGIQADIEEATALGLYTTPMIFLNGVELRGWRAKQGALARAVRLLAENRPPAATAAGDRPPPAVEKIVGDFVAQPAVPVPADTRSWPSGPADAPLRIVIWGDYQEPNTAAADHCARDVAARRGDVQYTFRHYPVDQSCNPTAPRTMHPQGCLAARAAEAAGSLGGAEAYWKMHAWLFEHQGGVTRDALRAVAPRLGLDAEALLAAMDDPAVAAAIEEDARAAWGFRGMFMGNFSIPLVLVNERPVRRWRHGGAGGPCLLDRIAEEAYRSASP